MSKRDQSTWRRAPGILESEHDEQEASRSARLTCRREKGNGPSALVLREMRTPSGLPYEKSNLKNLANHLASRSTKLSRATRRVVEMLRREAKSRPSHRSLIVKSIPVLSQLFDAFTSRGIWWSTDAAGFSASSPPVNPSASSYILGGPRHASSELFVTRPGKVATDRRARDGS